MCGPTSSRIIPRARIVDSPVIPRALVGMLRFSRTWIREAGMAVAITRTDLSAADLRREAARTRDAKTARRMLAIALVLEGRPRGEAAAQCGMDRQALRDWVHRYNAEGIAGLSDRPGRPGPKPCLSPAQEAEVGRWVEAGAGPAEHRGPGRLRGPALGPRPPPPLRARRA